MRYQFLPNAEPGDADILILPVPHEGTVTAKSGTSAAPAAILNASEQLEYYEEDAAWSPMLYLKVCVLPALTQNGEEAEHDFHKRLERTTAELPGTSARRLLIALGGEHSITPSLIAGAMPMAGTVVHLDAHADLRGSYQGSRYNHACPVYRFREQGHRVIMAGVRSLFEAEAQRIDSDDDIDLFRDRDLRNGSGWERFLERIALLRGDVWLTVDMDVFDPGQVPGVGTPQPGGLNWYQMLELMERLFANRDLTLRGMDIVELVPEPSQVSAITAAKIVQKAISFWGKAQSFDRRDQVGSQAGLDYE